MTKTRLMTVLKLGGLAVVIGLAVQLYRAKTAAEAQRAHIEKLERELAAERRALSALRAEEAYQERPTRLRALAADKLGMQPIQAYQLKTLSDAPRDPSAPAAAQEPTP